jgi:hypothetical protein
MKRRLTHTEITRCKQERISSKTPYKYSVICLDDVMYFDYCFPWGANKKDIMLAGCLTYRSCLSPERNSSLQLIKSLSRCNLDTSIYKDVRGHALHCATEADLPREIKLLAI